MIINPLDKTGRKIIKTLGLPVTRAARKVGSKIKYGLAGGDYGKQMEEKYSKTPEGKVIMESIKKNPWKALMDAIKSGNKKWFSE